VRRSRATDASANSTKSSADVTSPTLLEIGGTSRRPTLHQPARAQTDTKCPPEVAHHRQPVFLKSLPGLGRCCPAQARGDRAGRSDRPRGLATLSLQTPTSPSAGTLLSRTRRRATLPAQS